MFGNRSKRGIGVKAGFSVFRRKGESFSKSEKGTVAIEFAMVALPFFLLVFGILETALVFFAERNMAAAAQVAGREIRVGEYGDITTGDGGKTRFLQSLCDQAVGLPDCINSVSFDIRTVTTFAEADALSSTGPCEDTDGTGGFGFNGTCGDDIVVARVCYTWDLFTPLIGELFASPAGSGSRIMTGTTVWRNEPFSCSAAAASVSSATP